MAIILKNKKPVSLGSSYCIIIPKAYIMDEIIRPDKVYNVELHEVDL